MPTCPSIVIVTMGGQHMRKLSLWTAGLMACAVPSLIVPAQAADAAKEISTAATHAEMAGAAADAKMVQMHLHHVVNCIVGPGGMDFDAAAGNPCKDAGDGALKDAPDKAAPLTEALAKAKAGLATTDVSMAKSAAMEAAASLNKAK
jgi:hypothetical protein